MWPICGILLYWLMRIWLLAHRGEMNQDPILFAIKDRTSLILGGLVIACIGIAW